LTSISQELGLLVESRLARFFWKKETLEAEQARLEKTFVQPNHLNDEQGKRLFGSNIEREYSMSNLLRRPEVSYTSFAELSK
jgi:tRNA uridine 5-carboxymethylaminomethyl modification enzyme